MKKYLHIALMLLCVFVVSSCKDDDDDTEAVEREAYKLEQDIAFQAKVNETGFVRWYSEAGDGYVCAKLIEKGNGKQAYFNSRVSVYYKGSLTDGTEFDARLFEGRYALQVCGQFILCELFELQSEWIWFRHIWLDSCFATYG